MTEKHIFPAGIYYIGDPCYVIADKDWDTLLNRTGVLGCSDKNDDGSPAQYEDGIFTYQDKKCFATGTAYGDGEYGVLGTFGDSVAVDAGLIGIIPVDAITSIESADGGIIKVFNREFEVWENDGTFHFGKYTIKTSDEEEDDEEDDWD